MHGENYALQESEAVQPEPSYHAPCSEIWRLAYSPDDLLLASTSADGTVRLWEDSDDVLADFWMSECFVLTGVKNWRPKHCTVRRSAQVCQLWSFPETMQTGWSRHGWLALMVPIVVPPSGLCWTALLSIFFAWVFVFCRYGVWLGLQTGAGLQQEACKPERGHVVCPHTLYLKLLRFIDIMIILDVAACIHLLKYFSSSCSSYSYCSSCSSCTYSLLFDSFYMLLYSFLLFFFLALFCVLFDRFL